MNEKLLELRKEYDDYYDSFLKNGSLALKDTKLGFWGCACFDDVVKVFEKINLKGNFLDLGSGDGKVVLIASLFGAKAAGVEIDKELVGKAFEIRDKFKLDAEFFIDDFYEFDLSKFDVIFYNPDKPFNLWLENKLKKELKGVFLVYGNIFLPQTLEKKEEFWLNRTCVSVY